MMQIAGCALKTKHGQAHPAILADSVNGLFAYLLYFPVYVTWAGFRSEAVMFGTQAGQ
jgi:hypothetical protein